MSPPLVEQNHYEILEIPPEATREEIKSAYKKQALKWHPDRNPDDIRRATERFVQINRAYRALMRRPPTSQPLQTQIHNASPSRMTRSVSIVTDNTAPSHSTDTLASFFSAAGAASVESSTTAPPSPPGSSQKLPEKRSNHPYSPHQTSSSTEANVSNEEWISVEPDHAPARASSRKSKAPKSRAFYAHDRATKEARARKSDWKGIPTVVRPQLNRHQPNISATHLHQHPISSIGTGSSKIWRYSLALTLEDLFFGKECRFRITRSYLSGIRETIVLDVHIPPGCEDGTSFVFTNVGHQRRDGSFQDIVFVAQEVAHDAFARVGQDLLMKVQVPWSENLQRKDGRIHFTGLDNTTLSARISYGKEKRRHGQYKIKDGGMPILLDGQVVARGDLIVHWEITRPHHCSRWSTMKSWLGM